MKQHGPYYTKHVATLRSSGSWKYWMNVYFNTDISYIYCITIFIELKNKWINENANDKIKFQSSSKHQVHKKAWLLKTERI